MGPLFGKSIHHETPFYIKYSRYTWYMVYPTCVGTYLSSYFNNLIYRVTQNERGSPGMFSMFTDKFRKKTSIYYSSNDVFSDQFYLNNWLSLEYTMFHIKKDHRGNVVHHKTLRHGIKSCHIPNTEVICARCNRTGVILVETNYSSLFFFLSSIVVFLFF
uniref:Uncharacterized protein n=1 Tax=Cacopsylla melanoneura TaxID=428564 RepID=A0A8D8S0L8_9HEMI